MTLRCGPVLRLRPCVVYLPSGWCQFSKKTEYPAQQVRTMLAKQTRGRSANWFPIVRLISQNERHKPNSTGHSLSRSLFTSAISRCQFPLTVRPENEDCDYPNEDAGARTGTLRLRIGLNSMRSPVPTPDSKAPMDRTIGPRDHCRTRPSRVRLQLTSRR